jgi:glycerol-3-phosphate dehydrogenase subunit C
LTRLNFRPSEPSFWDESDLDREYRRQLDVCHTCRLCFNICPAFPDFFSRIDAVDGDMSRVSTADLDSFTDLCFECKLCDLKCPYVPPHEFMIEVPRVVLRSRALRAKRHGVKFGDRMLGDTDRMGEMASKTPSLANWGNSNAATRYLFEKMAGIDRHRLSPRFNAPTFKRWLQKNPPQAPKEPHSKVALFYSCLVNYNDPSIGRALLALLHHNGVEVVAPDQKCCGMPALDGGDMKAAVAKATFNVGHLVPYVDQGCDVVVPSPTCGYVLKKEYPDLVASAEAERVASHTLDASEFLVRLKKQGSLDTAVKAIPADIAYHVPCHYKAQRIGNKYAELLRGTGAKVKVVDKGCSGIDGTWGMKKEHYELSNKVASSMLNEIEASPGMDPCTDCLLAGLQITQGTGRQVHHPLQILAKSYGLSF